MPLGHLPCGECYPFYLPPMDLCFCFSWGCRFTFWICGGHWSVTCIQPWGIATFLTLFGLSSWVPISHNACLFSVFWVYSGHVFFMPVYLVLFMMFMLCVCFTPCIWVQFCHKGIQAFRWKISQVWSTLPAHHKTLIICAIYTAQDMLQFLYNVKYIHLNIHSNNQVILLMFKLVYMYLILLNLYLLFLVNIYIYV